MDSKVVVGTVDSFGFVSGLADSQTAWLANMSTFIQKYTCAVVNLKTWLSCSRVELTSCSVPLLAC